MGKRTYIAIVVAFVVGCLATLAIRPPSGGGAPVSLSEGRSIGTAVEKVTWRVPISFASNWEVLGDNIIYVGETIENLADGSFEFLIAEPAEIVPALAIVDAVREGKVKAGYTWLGYDYGKMPVSVLFGAVPFGMEPWEYTAWWYEAGGAELAQELYRRENMQILLCGLIGPETAGWFRSPIESLDDIEGLKIRFAGLGGEVLQRLGASVTLLPGPEIFQALDKGAIDATEYSLPNVDDALGFDKVAKLNYFPGWHQVFTALHLVVHIDEWNRLSNQHRSAIDTACSAGVTRNLAKAEAVQGAIVRNFASKGVTATYLPLDILRELERVSSQVLQEEASKDPDFARVLASQTEFRETYSHWKNVAYLPRDF